MVICYFNIKCVTAAPFKTDPPLIINSDAMLTSAVAAELFKSVCRRPMQVIESDGDIHDLQKEEAERQEKVMPPTHFVFAGNQRRMSLKRNRAAALRKKPPAIYTRKGTIMKYPPGSITPLWA